MNMDRWFLIYSLLGGAVLLVVAAGGILLRESSRQDLETRVLAVAGDRPGGRRGSVASYGVLVRLLQAIGNRIRHGTRLYSQKDLKHLQDVITAAGLNPRQVLPILLGTKMLLMVLMPVMAVLVASFFGVSARMRLLAVGPGLIAGIIGPEWILRMLRQSYVDKLQSGLPDALDLLVVCSESGMGLESALERVSQEMQQFNRPMAFVLAGLLDDLRVLPDRREAFARFGQRAGVEGLQRLAAMLGQSLQYGTPLSQALRAVATELRRDAMNRLEEKAAKLPAKLVLPMIGLIMPCLYIILIGSSFLRLYDALHLVMGHGPAVHH